MHFTHILCYSCKLIPAIPFDFLLLYDLLTSELENVFSNDHSRDEYACQVSSIPVTNYGDIASRETTLLADSLKSGAERYSYNIYQFYSKVTSHFSTSLK